MPYTESYKRLLTKLGYYNYQHGFIFRHLQQDGGWDDHLDKCRKYILKATEFYKPLKITVLGSGWLLELPLAEMIEKTDQICLIDIVQPPEVIRQVHGLKGVEVREEDISGGLIAGVWEKAGKLPFYKRLKTIRDIMIPDYIPGGDPGLVISLNVLTQIETLPIALINKKGKIKEDELNDFRREIQKKHIDFLVKYPSVLITDFVETFTDRSGNITEYKTVMTELPVGKTEEEWIWNFDLKRSDYYEKRSVLKVKAIVI